MITEENRKQIKQKESRKKGEQGLTLSQLDKSDDTMGALNAILVKSKGKVLKQTTGGTSRSAPTTNKKTKQKKKKKKAKKKKKSIITQIPCHGSL